jgi:TetR/AcrR family transcriptional regulator, transcriptional repressor for nem operon
MGRTDTGAKTKLLEAALHTIRAKGYSATSVDDLCQAAGVTKGAFFHHFESKEALAVAAADHFSAMAMGLFDMPAYAGKTDPLERLLGYIDIRRAILEGELPEYTCLLGTMVQETYETHPAIRESCERGIFGHAERLEADVAAAMVQYGVAGEFTAKSLAQYTQAVIQGAFILVKAKHDVQMAVESIGHLRRYVELLFQQPETAKRAA